MKTIFLIRNNIFIGLLGLLFFTACEDVNSNSSIQSYRVYINQNLNQYAIELRTMGGSKTYTEVIWNEGVAAIGYGGVLVIHGYDDNYYAFDMACPKEKKRTVRVQPNGAGQAVCEQCGSVFNIGYGSGNCVSGEAKEALRRFRVSVQASTQGDILQVNN
ncbi:MAG: hypothetical protein LBR81_00875 [Prevotellaceae bacterium]|jgi:nitrite reductase/ring-hydroxylating ferredoxin subunit|nr:hypothetical protein [Prevotellaceae bacterium]